MVAMASLVLQVAMASPAPPVQPVVTVSPGLQVLQVATVCPVQQVQMVAMVSPGPPVLQVAMARLDLRALLGLQHKPYIS
jgi:hypothetical protein